ncbi:MAG: hypothetical protein PHG48_08850, partial [Eubacteriales bacterium]|nr:hypothetical protein [Eubacteriales bacterium]
MSPKEILPVFTEASYHLSPWSGQTISGIENEAVKHSYQLQIYADTEGAPCRDNLPEVVIATSGKSDWNINMVAALENAGKRIVLAGLEAENFGEHISGAAFNRKDSVEIIVRYFYSCGRKKIAFFGIDKNSTNDMLRLDAFEQMLTTMGKADPSRDIFFVENIIEECYNRFSAHINSYDAVICPNDVVACY